MADVISITITGVASGLTSAVNQATGDLSKLEASATKTESVLSKIFGGIGTGVGMAAGLAGINGIAGAMGAVGDAAIGMNSKLEQSRIGFTSMLGSAEKADAFLKELQQFANTTPFEFPGLVTAAQRMLAFGFAAKDVKPLLTAVGSAAAAMGAGQSGIDRITAALGQMKAATVVQAGELNQLTEVGVPAFDILAKAVGVSTGEVKKLVSEGKIASDVFIDAFQEWASANFGDMMEKQSHTFEGAMSTIHDTLTSVTARAFKPLFDLVSQGADAFAQFTQTSTFTGWADAVASALEDITRQLKDVYRTIVQVFSYEWETSDTIEPFARMAGEAAVVVRDLIKAVTELPAPVKAGAAAFAAFLVSAGPITGILAGVTAAVLALTSPIVLLSAAVGVLVAAWVGDWGGIQEATAAAWAEMQPVLQQLLDWLAVQLPPALEWISTVGWPALVTAGQAVGQFITTVLIPAFTQVVLWLGTNLPPVIEWIANTGWPAVVTAGTAVATFITGTLIPGITQLVDWLGPKLMPVVTWITDTGWPALVTAGTAVGTMVVQVTQFFLALFTELEKRGVFEQLGQIWNTLISIGEKLGALITNVTTLAAALLLGITGLIGEFTGLNAVGAKVLEFFGGLISQAATATTSVQGIASAVQGFFAIIQSQLSLLESFLGMLGRLSSIQVPSLNFGGGGGSGAQTLSFGGGSLGAGPGARDSVLQWSDLITMAANEQGINPSDLAGLVDLESGGNPRARSGAGAMGLGQVMPFHFGPGEDPYDPLTNLRAAARVYRSNLNRYGDPVRAAAGYFGAGDNLDASDGGATGHDYIRIFQERRQRYQNLSTPTTPGGNALRGMQRLPLGDAGPLPPFMNETFEALPDYLKSLDTIQQQGTQTYETVAKSGKDQGDALAASQADATQMVFQTYTDAKGNIIGVVTEQAAGVVGAVTTQNTGVISQYDVLNTAVNASVQETMTGVNTTLTDGSGNMITTVTTTNGEILTQYATLANGAVVNMAAMDAGVTTSVTHLGEFTITAVTDMAGNVISTTTDMSGQVVAQTVTATAQVTQQWTATSASVIAAATEMGLQVIGQSRQMGEGIVTATKDSTGQMVSLVTDATGKVITSFKELSDGGKIVASGMDVAAKGLDNVIKKLKDTEKAAKSASDAIKDITQADKGGSKSGSGKSSGLGKAAGGPVYGGETYLVGEAGPELFTPRSNGTIIPNHQLGGIDYDALAAALARAGVGRGDSVTFNGVTSERQIREYERYQWERRMMEGI